MPAKSLPRKLKQDAIVEALFEVRFESTESVQFPEGVVGRLGSNPAWRGYRQVRLPLSDVPAPLRFQNADMKYLPVMELHEPSGKQIIKFGVNVISFHVLAPYPGWDASFESAVFAVADYTFMQFGGFKAVRLGLRYVNLMTQHEHGISSISDLNYKVQVAGEKLDVPQLLTFQRAQADHIAQVRIASPNFVGGNITKSFTAMIDVDVATPMHWETSSLDVAKQWLQTAHQIEKIEFFNLLAPKTLANLRAE